MNVDRERVTVRAAVLIVCLGLAALAARANGARGSEAEVDGDALYARECAACHGADGDGDGPGAYILSQKPRNFQLGVFKLRSTPSGEHPTDEDLFATITRGIDGANGAMMPSFASLTDAERWALVEVVKRHALIEIPGEPIQVPPRPSPDVARGRVVYERLECASCHGTEGRGDGESALTLEDDLKERVWTPDLTAGRYKGGDAPADIYKRIATGLDGSPMPSYADKATPEELWALTEFVLSLGRGGSAN